MTTETHKFFNKDEADAKSESLKHQWELGYGLITGPFAGDATNEFRSYYEVDEFIDVAELLKENEQLKEIMEAKNQAYYYEKNQLKALNAELLEALKQLHETTRKINPKYWGAYTPNALSYAEKLIAKAEAKH